jgi:hypothetical protein
MTAFVLISGQLFLAPEQQRSESDKPFVTAALNANSSQFWKILAFDESVQAELGRVLIVGSPMSVMCRIADSSRASRHFRIAPNADIGPAVRSPRRHDRTPLRRVRVQALPAEPCDRAGFSVVVSSGWNDVCDIENLLYVSDSHISLLTLYEQLT